MTGEIKIIDERKKEKRPKRRDFKWEVIVTAVFAAAILIYLMIPLESSTETNISTFTSENPPRPRTPWPSRKASSRSKNREAKALPE